MKSLEDLINNEDPFINVINQWVKEAKNHISVLPPSKENEQILLNVQVTTGSILGALIYNTGGVLIDHGWLRVLGSGSNEIPRNLHGWNCENPNHGSYLVADDAAGGFYAINGGYFSGEINSVYYLAPDSIEWENLELQFSDFFHWLITGDLENFYEGLRWVDWRKDINSLSTDQCVSFYPPLWTKEGDCNNSYRGKVPISEVLNSKYEFKNQSHESA